MMRARVRCGEDVFRRLDVARVASIEHREAVGELVADIEVLAVEHDLHAVEVAALIAPGDVLDAVADAFGRHVPDGRRCGGCGCRSRQRRGCQSEHSRCCCTACEFHCDPLRCDATYPILSWLA